MRKIRNLLQCIEGASWHFGWKILQEGKKNGWMEGRRHTYVCLGLSLERQLLPHIPDIFGAFFGSLEKLFKTASKYAAQCQVWEKCVWKTLNYHPTSNDLRPRPPTKCVPELLRGRPQRQLFFAVQLMKGQVSSLYLNLLPYFPCTSPLLEFDLFTLLSLLSALMHTK